MASADHADVIDQSVAEEFATFESLLTASEKERLRSIVSGLSALSPWRSLLALVVDWAIIACAISVGLWAASAWVTALCVVVIGTRQHALLLLMHDAAHRRLHPNRRVNEWIADVFCAFPLFVTTSTYRASHFDHHRFLNTDKDPDWIRRKGLKDWTFPKRRLELIALLVRQASGLGIFSMLTKALRFGGGLASPKHTHLSHAGAYLAVRVAYYGTAISVLTFLGLWTEFMVYWILPIATVLAVLMRLRSLAEHFGLDRSAELNSSRNVHPGPLERPLLGLHSSSLHLDHHLYPSVPFYNLRALHEALRQFEAYRTGAAECRSYLVSRRGSLFLKLIRAN